jgi:hydrogenase maturation protein HypF
LSQTALTRQQSDACIQQTAALLEQGSIVAIKGLGGYHLACDATNEQAVQTLRQRKRRSRKPFAVMMSNLKQVRHYCIVSDQEACVLTSPAHPIVLLASSADKHHRAVAPSVVNGLQELGVMLPYTPLQHLLMAVVGRPLVMTSGNISEEPIIARDTEAHELLGNVADAFLNNNRPIIARYDDSVVRVIDKQVHMLRRARGYAPTPLPVPTSLAVQKNILACGPEQKSTFCLVRGSEAFVSQHLGDLETAGSFNNYCETLERYKDLFAIRPHVLACDLHPEYLSTKWAAQQTREQNLPLISVQHHHAHIAAVIAENLTDESPACKDGRQIIGVAFDGTGYGADGTIWGGEVLLTSAGKLADYQRFAHLRHLPLPGGAAAIKHPDRLAYALLCSLGLGNHPGAQTLKSQLSKQQRTLLEQMTANNLRTPQTSSMGRLFDAVSALANICTQATYDGEPAIALEAALTSTAHPAIALEAALTSTAHPAPSAYAFALKTGATPLVIDHEPVILALLKDLAVGEKPGFIVQKFHAAIAAMVVDICKIARDQTKADTVALSGGVFMNRWLCKQVPPLLTAAGFTVLQHRALPANDGCIAYGQAVVAAAHLQEALD